MSPPPSSSVLGRPQLARSPVEDGIHELVPVSRTEALGQSHGLVDGHPVRHFRARRQLVDADEEDGVLDGIEQPRLAVDPGGEARIELLAHVPDSLHEGTEILRIRTRHVLRFAKLADQVLPRCRVELPAVQRLQRELARDAARATVFACTRGSHRYALPHSCAMTAASSRAPSIASPPLLPPVVAARCSACSIESTVSTPNITGTPLSRAACCSPRAHSPATYSKWGVPPRITQPSATTAS